jgi:hypothetical protein
METTKELEPIKPNQLPTVADLFSENIEMAFHNEKLNQLLNQEPNHKWVKLHPYIDGYKYIPIDKIEYMIRKIFKQYRIEITGQGTAFNGVWVTVRVHYLNPVTMELDFHDGIGACQLQTKKGTSPADLININNGAISMAFPIAKTIAIKDACDHFGKLFGCDLNRKDTLSFTFDDRLVMAEVEMIDFGQASQIETLLQGSSFAPERKDEIYNDLLKYSKEEAWAIIDELKLSQVNPIEAGHGYNTADIKEQVLSKLADERA